MKYLYTYHGHTIEADDKFPVAGSLPANSFFSEGVSVTCNTASLPYVIAMAVVFATHSNIRSLVIDGVELKRTN